MASIVGSYPHPSFILAPFTLPANAIRMPGLSMDSVAVRQDLKNFLLAILFTAPLELNYQQVTEENAQSQGNINLELSQKFQQIRHTCFGKTESHALVTFIPISDFPSQKAYIVVIIKRCLSKLYNHVYKDSQFLRVTKI